MITERVNGELAGKIGEEIAGLVLANISQITADVKQAIADREEGKEFGEVDCKVNFTIASRNCEAFFYEMNLEWERKKKTKSEQVNGEYDPNQPQLFEEEPARKSSRRGNKE